MNILGQRRRAVLKQIPVLSTGVLQMLSIPWWRCNGPNQRLILPALKHKHGQDVYSGAPA